MQFKIDTRRINVDGLRNAIELNMWLFHHGYSRLAVRREPSTGALYLVLGDDVPMTADLVHDVQQVWGLWNQHGDPFISVTRVVSF